MARVVTGARLEPGGLGGAGNVRKGGENIVTGTSAANARVNAGGAAGVGRAVSPARYSPHGDSLTSVNTSLPTTPTTQSRPGSKDNATCLTSSVREAAPAANQLSRSEQLIVKRTPVAQASNSERTVRFNPVVEILECPRRRCGGGAGSGGRGSPGGGASPLSPPPLLPPSPPLSRRTSRPRGGGGGTAPNALRGGNPHHHLRSPTPPPAHRKGIRNLTSSGGSGSLTAGGSLVSSGSRGLGEGSGGGGGVVNILRHRRSLRIPSANICSPTGSTATMGGVTHAPGPVRLAWRALAGRSAPRQASSLRPLRRRSGAATGPLLSTKGGRGGRGQRIAAFGMTASGGAVTSATPKPPAQSNPSVSANALINAAAGALPPVPAPAPTSQSTPTLQPTSFMHAQPPQQPQQLVQQGNVPPPSTTPQSSHQSSPHPTPVQSTAVLPLPAPPPPSLDPPPSATLSTTTPTADTTDSRMGSAGSRATYHSASNESPPASPSSSSASSRSNSVPPSGSFFGPKPTVPIVRSSPPKPASMSLATAQSTMAGVALARARAAALVARAGIIDTTPPAPPPSRGSEYGTAALALAHATNNNNKTTPAVAVAPATTTVAVVNKLPRLHHDDSASNSSKDTDTTTAPALSMALMHPLPIPATATSSTRDARSTPLPLATTSVASASAVSQRTPAATEGTTTTAKPRLQSPSPARTPSKGFKQRNFTPPSISNRCHSSRTAHRGKSTSSAKTTSEEQRTLTPSPNQPGSNSHSMKTNTPHVQQSQGKDSSRSSSSAPPVSGSPKASGSDDVPSTSGGVGTVVPYSIVPSVTGGCLAELISRSRNATLGEQQNENSVRVRSSRSPPSARTDVPATWGVDSSSDNKTAALAVAMDAAASERARAAGGDVSTGKSKERISSKATRPISPLLRKQTAKGPKRSAAKDKLLSHFDEGGDRTEKGEKTEKEEKPVPLKDDYSEGKDTKCTTGSSLNSMLKVVAPKGQRKKSQKRNHSIDKERTENIATAVSVPNVGNETMSLAAPATSPTTANITPTKATRTSSGGVIVAGGGPDNVPASAGNSGGTGGCMVGITGAGNLGGGSVVAGVAIGGSGGAGAVTSMVRLASGSKTSRISIGGALEKSLSISPETSMTSQLTMPPSTPDMMTSISTDGRSGKKGKRKAATVSDGGVSEPIEQTKMGKMKVKEKKKTSAGKSGKKKEEGSRCILKNSKDGLPRRSLSLTELGRTLRSGCWTLVEACIRGAKVATNGTSPQLTVVFRAKGSGSPTGTPLFRAPTTPPAGNSSQRQWSTRAARLTSASTSSRLSVLGDKPPATLRGGRGLAGGSMRGSSAGSCRDVRARNKGGGGGGGGFVSGVGGGGGGGGGGSFFGLGGGSGGLNVRGARSTRRRTNTTKRRPTTSSTRRRLPNGVGVVRLRGTRLGRRKGSGVGVGGGGGPLEPRGSTSSAHRFRSHVYHHHRSTLTPPTRRTNRGARRYPSPSSTQYG